FLRGADQLGEVRPLDVIELQRLADGVKDVLGDALYPAALELDVVLDADPGEHGHLIAPEPGHPTAAAISREPCPLRRDARPAGGQKLADLARGHTSSVRAAVHWRAGTPAPPVNLWWRLLRRGHPAGVFEFLSGAATSWDFT